MVSIPHSVGCRGHDRPRPHPDSIDRCRGHEDRGLIFSASARKTTSAAWCSRLLGEGSFAGGAMRVTFEVLRATNSERTQALACSVVSRMTGGIFRRILCEGR